MSNFADYNNLTLLFGKIGEKNSDIKSIVAPEETDATSSSRAYTIGQQLILDDALYTVTRAISIGDALTYGTNIALSDDLTSQIANSGGGSSVTFNSDDFNISGNNVVSLSASQRIFEGTQTEWDSLTVSERQKYRLVIINND